MYDFKKLRKYEKLREDADGFVFTPQMMKNHQILSKVLKTGRDIHTALIGSKGSGKHSLLTIALKEEERKVSVMHCSELLQAGTQVSKLISKNLRSTIEVKIKENQKIIEGEVVNLTNDKIHLKTMDMDSVFEIGVRMGKELEKERVCVGDVIKIYKENCFVTKIGRASTQSASFRSDLLPIVPVPEGECIKNENTESILTLDDLDVINSRENGEEFLYTNQLVSDHIQTEVDKRVNKWVKEGKAILEKGILIIEDCELMTSDSYNLLQACLNELYSPFVILIFNQESAINHGVGIKLYFNSYSDNEIAEIVKRNTEILDTNTRNSLMELAQIKGLNFVFKILNSVPKPITSDSLKKISNLFDF